MAEVRKRSCCKCGVVFVSARLVCDSCHATLKPMDSRLGKPLTFRERQIVLGLMDGLTNRAIARRLLLAEGTIKVYLSRDIASKVGVRSRLEIALWGFKKILGEANGFSS